MSQAPLSLQPEAPRHQGRTASSWMWCGRVTDVRISRVLNVSMTHCSQMVCSHAEPQQTCNAASMLEAGAQNTTQFASTYKAQFTGGR
jgi:hypothetical protein